MISNFVTKISVAAIVAIGSVAMSATAGAAATVSGVDIRFPGPSSGTIDQINGIVVVNESFGNFGNIEKLLNVENDGATGNQVFNITATNNTDSAWDRFVFNLVGDGGVTSFDQIFSPISDKFSLASLTDTSTKLTFSNGIVSPLETVNFRFAVNIPDIQGRNPGFGIQEKPFKGDAIPTPALLPGLFALGAGALRKRKQQAAGPIT
jgi:hypothetical protein